MAEYNLKEIIGKFNITDGATPYGKGHINDTYLSNACEPRYILQRINHNVFKRPQDVMENIVRVTAHLKKKIIEEGGDPKRETLNLVRTHDGEPYYVTAKGDYFRMYEFIEGAQTYEIVEEPIHFYNAAKAFAKFQQRLADFPAEKLHETIPSFHDTTVRFQQLKDAIANDKAGRLKDVQAEVEFALAREKDASVIVDAIKEGTVPLRVTHNDTKYNNIMIDDKTGLGICVIDLDTVMPGSLLYDYGDSLRFGTNPADEDEKDLSKVYCDLNLFEMFTKGYMEELKDVMTPREKELMPFSAKLMTYECGIRFLADYLNGDTYFKTKYPEHNLDRCHTQFKLVQDMEEKEELMKEIVKKYD